MSATDDLFSDDLREYMFSAQPDIVVIDTIELRHPAFDAPVRVANDLRGFNATLEDDAPVNGGETVAFQPGHFEIVPPDSPDSGLPKASIAVQNVTQLLSPFMDAGVSTNDPVSVTFRQYLSDDFSQPDLVIDGFSLANAQSSVLRIQADLTFEDILNAPFHDMIYRTDVFRGLSR